MAVEEILLSLKNGEISIKTSPKGFDLNFWTEEKERSFKAFLPVNLKDLSFSILASGKYLPDNLNVRDFIALKSFIYGFPQEFVNNRLILPITFKPSTLQDMRKHFMRSFLVIFSPSPLTLRYLADQLSGFEEKRLSSGLEVPDLLKEVNRLNRKTLLDLTHLKIREVEIVLEKLRTVSRDELLVILTDKLPEVADTLNNALILALTGVNEESLCSLISRLKLKTSLGFLKDLELRRKVREAILQLLFSEPKVLALLKYPDRFLLFLALMTLSILERGEGFSDDLDLFLRLFDLLHRDYQELLRASSLSSLKVSKNESIRKLVSWWEYREKLSSSEEKRASFPNITVTLAFLLGSMSPFFSSLLVPLISIKSDDDEDKVNLLVDALFSELTELSNQEGTYLLSKKVLLEKAYRIEGILQALVHLLKEKEYTEVEERLSEVLRRLNDLALPSGWKALVFSLLLLQVAQSEEWGERLLKRFKLEKTLESFYLSELEAGNLPFITFSLAYLLFLKKVKGFSKSFRKEFLSLVGQRITYDEAELDSAIDLSGGSLGGSEEGGKGRRIPEGKLLGNDSSLPLLLKIPFLNLRNLSPRFLEEVISWKDRESDPIMRLISYLLIYISLKLPFLRKFISFLRRELINSIETENKLFLREFLSASLEELRGVQGKLLNRLLEVAIYEPDPLLSAFLLAVYLSLGFPNSWENFKGTMRRDLQLIDGEYPGDLLAFLKKLLMVGSFMPEYAPKIFLLLLELLEEERVSKEDLRRIMEDMPEDLVMDTISTLISLIEERELKLSSKGKYLLLSLINLLNLNLPLEALGEFLKDEDPLVRAEVIPILANSEPDIVIDNLDLLLSDPSVRVRKEVIRFIGNLRSEEYVERLMRIYRDTSDPQEKVAVLSALRHFAEKKKELYLEAAVSPNREMREIALRTLKEIGGDVIYELYRLLPKATSTEIREDIEGTITDMSFQAVHPTLTLLREEPWRLGIYLEETIVKLLEKHPDLTETVISGLWDILMDEKASLESKAIAIRLLGKYRDKRLLKELHNFVMEEELSSPLKSALSFFTVTEFHENFLRRYELPLDLDLKLRKSLEKILAFLRAVKLYLDVKGDDKEVLRVLKKSLLEGAYLRNKSITLPLVLNKLVTHNLDSFEPIHYKLLENIIIISEKLKLNDLIERYLSSLVVILSPLREGFAEEIWRARIALIRAVITIGKPVVLPDIAEWLRDAKGKHLTDYMSVLKLVSSQKILNRFFWERSIEVFTTTVLKLLMEVLGEGSENLDRVGELISALLEIFELDSEGILLNLDKTINIVEELKRAYVSLSDPSYKKQILEALKMIPSRRTLKLLKDVIDHEADPELKREAWRIMEIIRAKVERESPPG